MQCSRGMDKPVAQPIRPLGALGDRARGQERDVPVQHRGFRPRRVGLLRIVEQRVGLTRHDQRRRRVSTRQRALAAAADVVGALHQGPRRGALRLRLQLPQLHFVTQARAQQPRRFLNDGIAHPQQLIARQRKARALTDVGAAGAIHEADRDAHAVAHRLDAAVDQRARVQRTRDAVAGHGISRAAERGDAVCGYDAERVHLLELRDQPLSQAGSDVAEGSIPAQVAEVEDGDAARVEPPRRGRPTSAAAADHQPSRQDDQRDHRGGDDRRAPAPAPAPRLGGDARDSSRARRGQRLGEFSGRLIPVRRHLLQRALDHEFEIVRDGVAHDLEPRHRIE